MTKRLTSKPQDPTVCTSLPVLGLQAHTTPPCLAFCVDAENPNLDPPVYAAGTLPMKPSSQPLHEPVPIRPQLYVGGGITSYTCRWGN